MKPLYGHESPETAYVVADYPYGRTVRTTIRYWLEFKGGMGWRFVSQTVNPKTGAWNKPKASTYTAFGAAMYLDEQDHVTWASIGGYASADKVRAFVERFPGANFGALRAFVPMKLASLQRFIDGSQWYTVNGAKGERTERELASDRAELAEWQAIAALIARPA